MPFAAPMKSCPNLDKWQNFENSQLARGQSRLIWVWQLATEDSSGNEHTSAQVLPSLSRVCNYSFHLPAVTTALHEGTEQEDCLSYVFSVLWSHEWIQYLLKGAGGRFETLPFTLWGDGGEVWLGSVGNTREPDREQVHKVRGNAPCQHHYYYHQLTWRGEQSSSRSAPATGWGQQLHGKLGLAGNSSDSSHFVLPAPAPCLSNPPTPIPTAVPPGQDWHWKEELAYRCRCPSRAQFPCSWPHNPGLVWVKSAFRALLHLSQSGTTAASCSSFLLPPVPGQQETPSGE